MTRLQRWLVVCLLLVCAPFAAACVPERPIKLGALDWESGQFTTAVLQTLLQQGYGCTVETVPGTTTALETALAQDDIQIIANNGWVVRPSCKKRLTKAARRLSATPFRAVRSRAGMCPIM